jgi:DNA repair ATPase RecN
LREKLQRADTRIEELQTELRSAQVCIRDASVKLQEFEEITRVERSRLEAAERKICELEMRARTAEARAKERSNILAQIDEAIRTQILEKRLPQNKLTLSA